jgi:ribosomal protein L25 (general stress protein Ctc)
MTHEIPTINAAKRERLGSRYAQRLRKTGHLPAVIYGHGNDPVSVSIEEKATLAYLHRGQHVFNVAVDGAATETCLVKDLQFGFLGDDVIHIDLARVNVCDTIPDGDRFGAIQDKITVLSVAKLLGEAVHRIHHDQSVSAMFRTGVGTKR